MPLNRRHKAVFALVLLIAGATLVAGQGLHVFIGLLVMGTALALLIGSNSRAVHTLFLAIGLGAVTIPVAIDSTEAWGESKAYEQRLDAFRRRLQSFKMRYPLPGSRTFGSVDNLALHTKSDGSGISIGPTIDISAGWVDVPSDPSTALFDPPWPCYITREARQKIRQRLEDALLHDDIEALLQPGLVRQKGSPERNPVPPPGFVLVSSKETGRAVAKETLKQLDEADRYPLPEWFQDAVRAGVDARNIPDAEKPGVPPAPFRLSAVLGTNSMFIVPGMILAVTGLGCLVYLRRAMRNKGG